MHLARPASSPSEWRIRPLSRRDSVWFGAVQMSCWTRRSRFVRLSWRQMRVQGLAAKQECGAFSFFFCFSGVHDVRSRSRRGAKLEMIVDITTCQKRGSTMINHDYLCLGSGNDSSIDVRSRYPFRSTAKLVSTVGLEERCFKWASIVQ